MKTFTHHAVTPVVAVLATLLATSAVAATTDMSNGGGADTASVSEYAVWGDPAMARIAVDSGRALLEHLRTARALLDTDRIPQARSALLASREFADAIQRSMPYLTVVTDMRNVSKKVTQEDVTAFSADLLPIYANLDELQVFAPQVAKRTRSMVQQAEKHASAGHPQRAAQVLTEAADDIAQHSVYLPVDYVDEQVHVASRALDRAKPDVATANAAVGRALNSVVTVVDEVIAPTS